MLKERMTILFLDWGEQVSLTDVVVGALIGGGAVIAGGVIVVKYRWRKQIDFVCIREIYVPLHKKIIEKSDLAIKNMGIFQIDLAFVHEIKNNYWYSRASPKISEKLEEWQSRASEYNAMIGELHKKIEKVVNQEIDKRVKALEPPPNNEKIINEFKEMMGQGFLSVGSIAPRLLVQEKTDDAEYYFIVNFKRGVGHPKREIRAKLANGFPAAIYEEIRAAPLLSNLHNKGKEVEDATARLRAVLEKRTKK